MDDIFILLHIRFSLHSKLLQSGTQIFGSDSCFCKQIKSNSDHRDKEHKQDPRHLKRRIPFFIENINRCDKRKKRYHSVHIGTVISQICKSENHNANLKKNQQKNNRGMAVHCTKYFCLGTFFDCLTGIMVFCNFSHARSSSL